MSEAHLVRYCSKFDPRYDTRNIVDTERAAEIVKSGIGRRLVSAD